MSTSRSMFIFTKMFLCRYFVISPLLPEENILSRCNSTTKLVAFVFLLPIRSQLNEFAHRNWTGDLELVRWMTLPRRRTTHLDCFNRRLCLAAADVRPSPGDASITELTFNELCNNFDSTSNIAVYRDSNLDLARKIIDFYVWSQGRTTVGNISDTTALLPFASNVVLNRCQMPVKSGERDVENYIQNPSAEGLQII